MNPSCDVHTLRAPVHAATRDDTILPDTAQTDRGNTITPPALAEVDSPVLLQAPEIPVLPDDTQYAPAQDLRSHDTACPCGVQLQDTERIATNSDPLIHSDGIVDLNPTQATSNTENTAENNAPFPLITANDYDNDAEFSGMYQYLLNGILSGNARKDKPILIMEDKYIIDADDLLYRVDISRRKIWPN